MDQKKIILITPAFGKGGGEKQLFSLAKYLEENGFLVLIICLLKTNMFEKELNESNIQFVSLNMDKSKWHIFKYLKIVKSFNPGIIVSFMYPANIVGRLTKFLFGYPLITSVRSEKFGGRMRDWLFKITSFTDDFTVVNSFSVMQNLIKRNLIQSRKTINIPNIIHLKDYSASEKLKIRKSVRDELNIEDNIFVFLFVGHFRPEKDYETLFQGVVQLKDNFKLVMAGNLSGQNWPGKRINELGLDSKITLLGEKDDITRFYIAADSLVLSSITEGLPNAIMEAMSLSLPVVSTNVGGVIDLVEDNLNGFLCNPGNPDQLADSMQKMLNLPINDRLRMGEYGLRRIQNEFEKNVVMKKWSNIISKLL